MTYLQVRSDSHFVSFVTLDHIRSIRSESYFMPIYMLDLKAIIRIHLQVRSFTDTLYIYIIFSSWVQHFFMTHGVFYRSGLKAIL